MNRKNRRIRQRQTGGAIKSRQSLVSRDVEGRVHLLQISDPIHGTDQLLLAEPVFQEDWQNRIALAAAKTSLASLKEDLTLRATIQLGRNLMTAASQLANKLLSQAPPGNLACRAGCDHCCHQSVGATPPEIFTIFEHLKETRSPAEFVQIGKKLAAYHDRTEHRSSDERFSPEYACPFLEEKKCSIYEVRPLSCRGMNSLDEKQCASRLRDPETRKRYLNGQLAGCSYVEPIRGFHAISAGLQLCLNEIYHLDMRPIHLIAALCLLFEGSESIAEEWISGLPSFESALSDSALDDLLLGELSGRLNSADAE